ncbi:hypothetical protein GA0070616_5224 [Micromonospora nigra]|uniref:Hpr(Ser) kinase/phosphatase n=1 Tax=Micromonospora nigra TaxID=145857 RepID=A0A1C6T237_9ACTN|nr:hypothetical protein [Micromonospora nigra]SCL35425.1 hypothetical protein GA0070616_5224 [Micromonospora nigra]
MSTGGRFVYGLCVRGLDGVEELSAPGEAGDGHIAVHVRQATGPPPPPAPTDTQRGIRVLADGRTLVVDRLRGTATFYGPALTPDVLAHPYLAPVATIFNRWAGRETFHSGAFVQGGRAWAVVGPRTAGKSSLLATLAARDVPVVADDILVVDGNHVYAGPRCVDLRQPVPGTGQPGRLVRAGDRVRVALPPIEPRVPLGGWIFLRWGGAVELTRVPGSVLLARLAGQRSWPRLPSDPAALLTIGALPAWDLTRPRDWSALVATHRVVEGTLDAQRVAGGVR